jgi:hypothetical protein
MDSRCRGITVTIRITTTAAAIINVLLTSQSFGSAIAWKGLLDAGHSPVISTAATCFYYSSCGLHLLLSLLLLFQVFQIHLPPDVLPAGQNGPTKFSLVAGSWQTKVQPAATLTITNCRQLGSGCMCGSLWLTYRQVL